MFAITPATLAIAGSAERFPVRRVYCVGRNYPDHAREMGADPDREPPFYFTKPSDAVFTTSEGYGGGPAHRLPYPPQTQNLHHEIELVVALGAGGAGGIRSNAVRSGGHVDRPRRAAYAVRMAFGFGQPKHFHAGDCWPARWVVARRRSRR